MKLYALGSNISLVKILSDGNENLFIKAELFDKSLNLIRTFELTHKEKGIYHNDSIPANTLGVYHIRYQVFKDHNFTIKAKYKLAIDTIRIENIVNELKETIDYGDGNIN